MNLAVNINVIKLTFVDRNKSKSKWYSSFSRMLIGNDHTTNLTFKQILHMFYTSLNKNKVNLN